MAEGKSKTVKSEKARQPLDADKQARRNSAEAANRAAERIRSQVPDGNSGSGS